MGFEAYLDFLKIFEDIPFIAYIIFGLGVMLLMIEMSMPGFGVAGVGSIIAFLISIVIAADTVAEGLIFAGIVLLVSIIIIVVFFLLISKGKIVSGMILSSSTSKEEGFTSAAEDFTALIGCTGAAETTLRPAGRAEINGRIYDVVTSGNFVEAGAVIRVQEVTGSRIVVAADHT